jgi:hypothetical protein
MDPIMRPVRHLPRRPLLSCDVSVVLLLLPVTRSSWRPLLLPESLSFCLPPTTLPPQAARDEPLPHPDHLYGRQRLDLIDPNPNQTPAPNPSDSRGRATAVQSFSIRNLQQQTELPPRTVSGNPKICIR